MCLITLFTLKTMQVLKTIMGIYFTLCTWLYCKLNYFSHFFLESFVVCMCQGEKNHYTQVFRACEIYFCRVLVRSDGDRVLKLHVVESTLLLSWKLHYKILDEIHKLKAHSLILQEWKHEKSLLDQIICSSLLSHRGASQFQRASLV